MRRSKFLKMKNSKELVEILDNFLLDKKISRRQFCRLSGIPNSTITSWKHKKVLPSVELVGKVARFMNVSLDWLVFGDDSYCADKIEYRTGYKQAINSCIKALKNLRKEN